MRHTTRRGRFAAGISVHHERFRVERTFPMDTGQSRRLHNSPTKHQLSAVAVDLVPDIRAKRDRGYVMLSVLVSRGTPDSQHNGGLNCKGVNHYSDKARLHLRTYWHNNHLTYKQRLLVQQWYSACLIGPTFF